jgi:hypothetical protein
MRRRVRNLLAIWGGWTALALFFAVSASLTYLSTGRSANWRSRCAVSLEWWLWALLTPIVVRLARRYPLDRHWPWRHGLIHGRGTVLAVFKTVAERVLFAWLTGVWTCWLISTLALSFLSTAPSWPRPGFVYYERSRSAIISPRVSPRSVNCSTCSFSRISVQHLNTIAELVRRSGWRRPMITGLSDLLQDAGPQSTQEILSPRSSTCWADI